MFQREGLYDVFRGCFEDGVGGLRWRRDGLRGRKHDRRELIRPTEGHVLDTPKAGGGASPHLFYHSLLTPTRVVAYTLNSSCIWYSILPAEDKTKHRVVAYFPNNRLRCVQRLRYYCYRLDLSPYVCNFVPIEALPYHPFDLRVCSCTL